MDRYEICACRGHVEVYKDGEFVFSADDIQEARATIELYEGDEICV